MAILKNCSATGCGTGFEYFTEDESLIMDGCSADNCGTGFLAKLTPEQISKLYSTFEANKNHFDDLEKKVNELPVKSTKNVKLLIMSSVLAGILSKAADLTTVVDFILTKLNENL